MGQCVNCRIPHSLSSLLFDHKPVFLQFNRFNPYKKQTIDDSILKDADLSEIVSITALECYINHLIPSENLSDLEIDNFGALIGRVLELQKELTSCKLKDSENGFDQANIDRIRHLRLSIKNNIEQLPTVDTLQNYGLSCECDVFLEIFIMAIKNSSLAHQHDFFKIKNAKKNKLEKQIKALKLNFQNNVGEILRVERDLNKVVDDDMREEVLKMRKFEQLNNEKINPYFLSLAKKPNKSESLLDLCKDNGEPFETAGERDNFIREYYATTYKTVANNVNEHSINNFLGDVANHPEVIASKLNQEEREDLEKNISINEFDKAL